MYLPSTNCIHGLLQIVVLMYVHFVLDITHYCTGILNFINYYYHIAPNFQGSKFSQAPIFIEIISQIRCVCTSHTYYSVGVAYKPGWLSHTGCHCINFICEETWEKGPKEFKGRLSLFFNTFKSIIYFLLL